jgi:hypothetical protein
MRCLFPLSTKIGPGEVNLIATAVANIIGENKIINTEDPIMSIILLMTSKLIQQQNNKLHP